MHRPDTQPTTSTDRTTLAPQLRREWERLRHRPHAIEEATRWGVTDEPFDDLDELLVLAGYRCAASPDADAVLLRLLERAAVDQLAARIVLQRILPGLLAVVRRRGCGGRPHGLLEELVGAAWITIRTFDVRRRPACLAAALICGAEHVAFRGPQRRRAAMEVPVDPSTETAADVTHIAPGEELAEVLRWAQVQGLDADDAELVRRIVDAESPQQLAAELGVTTRTVRNRRDRVTYRLRRLSVAA